MTEIEIEVLPDEEVAAFANGDATIEVEVTDDGQATTEPE